MKSMSWKNQRKSTTQAENGSVNFLRIGSGTNISIKRPSASTPIVRLQPTSFLQGVTPLREIFSDDNSSDRKSHAASLPPSYATHDPIDYGSAITGKSLQHSFTYNFHEHSRQGKPMAGNETDPNNFQSNSNSNFRPHGQGRTSQTFANRSTYSHAAASAPTPNDGSMSCFYCNQSHLMTDCKGFYLCLWTIVVSFAGHNVCVSDVSATVTQTETVESECIAPLAMANTPQFFMMTADNKETATPKCHLWCLRCSPIIRHALTLRLHVQFNSKTPTKVLDRLDLHHSHSKDRKLWSQTEST